VTLEEFADAVEIDDDALTEAYQVFVEESAIARKTLAHRTVDLAWGLRQLGIDEAGIAKAVELLAVERRR
jgi:hypothetical protein